MVLMDLWRKLKSPQDAASLYPHPEPKSRQQQHCTDPAALQAYETSSEERQVLTWVRLDLESLRILLQRINKREKLKRDGKLLSEP